MGFGSFVSGLWHGAEHTAQDLWAGATGGKSWEQQQHEQQAQNAAKQGNAQRAALQAQSQGLHVGQYDPPSIQQQDNWQAMSQQDIYQGNQKLDQQAAEDVGRAWASLAKQLRQMGPDYVKGLKQKIASGWEGEAAQAASNVGDPLGKWMGDSANAFQDTGIRIQEAASAAGQVKTMVGPPATPSLAQQFGEGIAIGTSPVVGVVDSVQQMQQQQQDQKAAQETMARVLGTTYQQADSQVPAYQDVHGKEVAPPPPPPPSPSPPLPPPVQGGGGAGGGGGTAGRHVSVPNFGGGAGMPGGGAVGGSPVGDLPAGTQSAAAAAVPSMTGDLGSATMAGGGAAGGGAGGGGAGVGMMGGVGGGMAGGRAGGLSAGGRAGGLGAAGRAGAAGSSGSGAGARGGSAGSAGGRGGSSSSSSGAGGRGGHGSGGEDDEHERPSWLEEQDDIWLNDMPRVAPPVFGE